MLIGNMVEVSAKLIHTGKTSLHVALEVSAGDPPEWRGFRPSCSSG